jgi:hypothetical protein
MSKQYTTAFLVFLALFSLATSNMVKVASTDACPDFDYRPAAFTSNLIGSLNKVPRDQRKAAFEAELKKDTLFISSSDAVKIFKEVRFERDQVSDLCKTVNGFVIRFTPVELSQIIKGVKKRLQPKVALAFRHSLSDVSVASKELVLNSVECTTSRDKIRKEFENIKVKSCFSGDSSKDVVFLIDLSGSMQYTFTKNGKTFSRLTFLKPFIVSALRSLESYVKFKIVTFASGVKVWKTEWVSASATNKAEAIKFVENMRGLGMTNTIGALREAFKVDLKEFNMLVFTDGMPTKEETDTSKIVQFVVDLNESRVKKGQVPVKLDLTTVMLGGKGTEEEEIEKAQSALLEKKKEEDTNTSTSTNTNTNTNTNDNASINISTSKSVYFTS